MNSSTQNQIIADEFLNEVVGGKSLLDSYKDLSPVPMMIVNNVGFWGSGIIANAGHQAAHTIASFVSHFKFW